jgi:hypothetical protein
LKTLSQSASLGKTFSSHTYHNQQIPFINPNAHSQIQSSVQSLSNGGLNYTSQPIMPPPPTTAMQYTMPPPPTNSNFTHSIQSQSNQTSTMPSQLINTNQHSVIGSMPAPLAIPSYQTPLYQNLTPTFQSNPNSGQTMPPSPGTNYVAIQSPRSNSNTSPSRNSVNFNAPDNFQPRSRMYASTSSGDLRKSTSNNSGGIGKHPFIVTIIRVK